MFLPILGYDDGYGFTYGGRVSTIDLLGHGRAPLGAADLGRHAAGGARVRAHVQVGTADPHRIERSASRSARTRASRSTISASGGRRAPNAVSRAWCEPASTPRSSTVSSTRSTIVSGRSARTPPSTRAAIPAFRAMPCTWARAGPACTSRGLDEPINRYTADARGYLGVIRQAVARRTRRSTRPRIARFRRTNGSFSAERRACVDSAPAPSTAIACSSRQPSCACRSRPCSAAPSSA